MEDTSTQLEDLVSFLIPVITISLVVVVQISFWMPSSSEKEEEQQLQDEKQKRPAGVNETKPDTKQFQIYPSSPPPQMNNDKDAMLFCQPINAEKALETNNNTWKCSCEGGFFSAGMLKTFGSAEAVMRLGSGQCYHKQM